MQRVRFSDDVTVYELDDACENRRSRWVFAAANRRRFQRRIAQTTLILKPVLTEEHRLRMWLRTIQLRN